VVPVITGSSLKAAQWANALSEEGINMQPIFLSGSRGEGGEVAVFYLLDA
jgi:hypothetical protein